MIFAAVSVAYFSLSFFVSRAVIAVVIVFFFVAVLVFQIPSSRPSSFFLRAISAAIPFPLPLADCGGFLGVIAGNSDHFVSSSFVFFVSLSFFAHAFVFCPSRLKVDVRSPLSSSKTEVVLLFHPRLFGLFLSASPPKFPACLSRRRQRLRFLSSSFVASRARFMATSMSSVVVVVLLFWTTVL